MKAEFFLVCDPASFGFHLYHRLQKGEMNAVAVAKPVEYETVYRANAPSLATRPMLSLEDGAFQELMNALWVAGIRPSKPLLEPSNERHLVGEIDWLRSVVGHQLKMPK